LKLTVYWLAQEQYGLTIHLLTEKAAFSLISSILTAVITTVFDLLFVKMAAHKWPALFWIKEKM
jgi:hypothetical protein